MPPTASGRHRRRRKNLNISSKLLPVGNAPAGYLVGAGWWRAAGPALTPKPLGELRRQLGGDGGR